jgi:GT2 family glycosyltransferase
VAELSATDALLGLREEPAPERGTLVSVVVVTRDGEDRLQRLLEGLRERTNYREIELVVVDNASRNGAGRALDAWAGTLQVLPNQERVGFAAATNQAIRAATGDLVLLAHDDVEPFHPHWLGYLVDSLAEDVTAVGPLLIAPDHTVENRGRYFEPAPSGARVLDAGAGEDALSVVRPARYEVPAMSAACLLARRSDLLENLLDESYAYGGDEWDLCVRLGNVGRVVLDERAVLYHLGDGTREGDVAGASKYQRRSDLHAFNGVWGPSLLRRLRTEVTGPRDGWFFRGDRTPKFHLSSGETELAGRIVERLREEAEAAAWEVTHRTPQTCDVAISLRPPEAVQWFANQGLGVAVVLDQEEAWVQSGGLDAAKIVLAPNPVVAARLGALWGPGIVRIDERLNHAAPGLFAGLLADARPRPDAMRIGVATCAPHWEKSPFWGDTHLAHGLMRAFRRLGHDAVELTMDDWQGQGAASCDVVVHLRGLYRRPAAKGQWNVLWVISHPDRLEDGECDDYDIVATASLQHAQLLSAETGREVHYLPQATDADTFRVGQRSTDYEGSVLYVGNARWPHRRAPRWLMRIGRDFDLYGRHWRDFPEARHVRGDYIPNRELPTAYRSAGVGGGGEHG